MFINFYVKYFCFTAQLHRFHIVRLFSNGRADGNVGGRGIEQHDAQP